MKMSISIGKTKTVEVSLTETIFRCDNCGHEETDHGEEYIGGSPFHGWYSLNRFCGSTALPELQKKRDWDCCSLRCLKELMFKLEN